MSKIVMFNMMTLDGFFEGPNRSIDWHQVDAEFNDFAIAQLNSAQGLIFGRVTYELMASYWPTPAALADDPAVAGLMNAKPKIVVSQTLPNAGWAHTRVVRGDIPGEFASLRAQPGQDWLVFGSADLSASLARDGLIDEYRVMLNPIILGSGKPLFGGFPDRQNLGLVEARPFKNGNVLLTYRPQTG